MARKLRRGERLVLASHNAGKLREIEAMLRPLGIEVVSAAGLGLAEPVEDAPDFAGNARIKALAAAAATGLPALSDDSGFCVAALGGAPGVLSARWAGPGKDFAAAMATVNQRIGASTDRRAWFVAALCLGWPDGHTETFVGRIAGQVVWPPRGTRGFGYDPIFVPGGSAPPGVVQAGVVQAGVVQAGVVQAGAVQAGGGRTFGEMDPDEKQAVNHRARAFAQVLSACFGWVAVSRPRHLVACCQ